MKRHVVVPSGQERVVIRSLVGPTVQLEPVCPICGSEGAHRRWYKANEEGERDYSADGPVAKVPCYLDWCAAHGVHGPIRAGERLPFSFGSDEDKAHVEPANIFCDACGYGSHPSAFCIPTGPSYEPT